MAVADSDTMARNYPHSDFNMTTSMCPCTSLCPVGPSCN